MSKFVSINKAAFELGIHEYDLFESASDSRIKMYWLPYEIKIVEIELANRKSDLDDKNCETWIRVTGRPVIEHECGPFEIDLTIDDRWQCIFAALKNNECTSYVIHLHGDPMKFKSLNGIVYQTYFDTPYDYVLPKANELRIKFSELNEIKKTLKAIREGSANSKNFVTNQRLKAIKTYLDIHNKWERFGEKPSGKTGFRDEVWQALENLKDNNGNFIFSKKGENSPNKISCFKPVWSQIRKNHFNQ